MTEGEIWIHSAAVFELPRWALNSLQTAVFVFAYVRLQVNDCAVDFGKMAPPPLIHGTFIADVLRRRDGGKVPDL